MTTPATAELGGAWDDLVRQHEKRVHRLAYRLSGNRADAEDLTQEVFLRAFRAFESFDPVNVNGWLHRITTNLFLDQVRRRARIRFEPLGGAVEATLAARVAAPDHDLFDADVESALGALRPEFRASVLLCDVDGLTYEEVADVLGLKLGTVRSRIHRGRAQLRRSLAHRAPLPGQRHRGPSDSGDLRAPQLT